MTNKVVLVTGASSGIGAALARRFAADGEDLVLIARRADRLAALAEEIRDRGRRCEVLAADIAESDAPTRLVAEARTRMGRIDVLVNNAGVGEYGEFATQDISALDRMMRVNMTAVVELTHAVLPEMIARRSGAILNIASTAAFQPTPYQALYGATKAFVRNLSLALWRELRGTGVQVTCICPGPVRTEFFDRGGYQARREAFLKLGAEPDWVAERAYRALAAGRMICTPGMLNGLGAFLTRFGSLKTATNVAAKILRPR